MVELEKQNQIIYENIRLVSKALEKYSESLINLLKDYCTISNKKEFVINEDIVKDSEQKELVIYLKENLDKIQNVEDKLSKSENLSKEDVCIINLCICQIIQVFVQKSKVIKETTGRYVELLEKMFPDEKSSLEEKRKV